MESAMNISKRFGLAFSLAIWSFQACVVWSDPMPNGVSQSQSNIPAEFQNAISNAFPGYQILNPSEVFLDKDKTESSLYNALKNSPSLITGKFNDDTIEDFVALIRSTTTMTKSWAPHGELVDKNNLETYAVYAVNLAICYGLGNGKFNCQLKPKSYGQTSPGIFGEIYLPTGSVTSQASALKYVCTSMGLQLQAGGGHTYKDDFGKNHGDYDEMRTEIDTNGNGSSRLSVTKFQENLRYELTSQRYYLRCTGVLGAVPLPGATSNLLNPIPIGYQDVISNFFPDHRILTPHEIVLNKNEIGPKLYDKMKTSPSLIVGKFNDDKIEDFAALTRNIEKKYYQLTPQGEVVEELYWAHLVACFGLGGGKYNCLVVPGAFRRVGLSTDWALNITGPGIYHCTSTKKLDLSHGLEPVIADSGDKRDERHERHERHVTLVVKTDVINLIKTSYSGSVDHYVYQSKDSLLKCEESYD
jgi:hypothetical protein